MRRKCEDARIRCGIRREGNSNETQKFCICVGDVYAANGVVYFHLHRRKKYLYSESQIVEMKTSQAKQYTM